MKKMIIILLVSIFTILSAEKVSLQDATNAAINYYRYGAQTD